MKLKKNCKESFKFVQICKKKIRFIQIPSNNWKSKMLRNQTKMIWKIFIKNTRFWKKNIINKKKVLKKKNKKNKICFLKTSKFNKN